jgi:sporulation protein YlmC with PRC-barrel domain
MKRKIDLIRDVLDNQIVDRNQRKMGKVDGIVVELRDDQPPRLIHIETGATVLARRLHPRLAQWVATWQSKWGAKRQEAFRIPWSAVRQVGIDVEVDLDAEQTPALAYEIWLREHLIQRIPGGK